MECDEMFNPDVFNFREPYIEIVRKPKKYGYRFRYKTEGTCHGGILAQPSVNCGNNKSCPMIKVHNLNGRSAKVVLRLAAEHNKEVMHIHSLVYNKVVTKGFHILDLNEANEVELEHVAVQQEKVKKGKEFLFKERVLQSRYLKSYQTITPSVSIEAFVNKIEERADKRLINRETGLEDDSSDLHQEASELIKELNVHSVVLAFHGFLQDKNGNYTIHLPTAYSDPIYDGKNKKGCEYKILRMSTVCGSPKGGDEVWMLCDKFNMADVEVHFFEDTPLITPWHSNGIFNKSDVYNQRLVIFRTPPYKIRVLEQPVKVKVELRARSDHNRHSNHFEFTYTSPIDDGYEVGKKRKKVAPAVPDFDAAQHVRSLPEVEEYDQQLINNTPQQLSSTDNRNPNQPLIHLDSLPSDSFFFYLNDNSNQITDDIFLDTVGYLTIQDDTTLKIEGDNEAASKVEECNIADASNTEEDNAYLTFPLT